MNHTSWKTITNRDQSELHLALPEPAWVPRANPTGLAVLTREYAPISLKEMDAVALLDRTDTKFILTDGQLLQALAAVQQDYRS